MDIDSYWIPTLILLCLIGIGLLSVLREPERMAQLLVVQLLGTIAVTIILLMARLSNDLRMLDLALVVSALASVVAIAFVRYGSLQESHEDSKP